MIKSYPLDCFIIKRKNYHEADKLITVFSKQSGLVTLKAKGIRKLTSRRLGLLELFNRVEIMVIKSKGDIDIITEVMLNKNFAIISSDFYRTKIAYELVELINRLSAEQIENIPLYRLIDRAFDFIASRDFTQEIADKTALRFKLRILEIMGYGLHLDPSHEKLNTIIEELIEKKLVAHSNFSM